MVVCCLAPLPPPIHSQLEAFCVEWICLPDVSVSFQAIRLPKTCAFIRLIGDSKLAAGVKGWLSLGVPYLLPYDVWDRLQPICDPELDKQTQMDGWT